MNERNQYEKQLDLVMKILYFFKHHSLFIIDEIDTVMDLTVSLNFNTHHLEKHEDVRISQIIQEFFSLKKEWEQANQSQSVKKFKFKEIKDFKGSELIKICMEKELNFHYGLAPLRNLPSVVPFEAANTPSERSTFADFWLSLALSVKYYLEESFEDAPSWINPKEKTQLIGIFAKNLLVNLFSDVWSKVTRNAENFESFIRALCASFHHYLSTSILLYSCGILAHTISVCGLQWNVI